MDTKTLKPQSWYIVKSFNLSQFEEDRLINLGFEINSEVQFLRKSIFGDPFAFLIRGNIISISKKSLLNIELTPKIIQENK